MRPAGGTLGALGARSMRPARPPEHSEVAPIETPSVANDPRLARVVVVNKSPPAEVARTVLVVLGVVVGAYLLWRVQEVLFLLFLAVLLATAIEPIVNRLRRGPFTRGTGVLAVYTAIVILVAVPAYILVPSVANQAGSFMDSLPQQLTRLRDIATHLQPRLVQPVALDGVDSAARAVQSPQTPPPEQGF